MFKSHRVSMSSLKGSRKSRLARLNRAGLALCLCCSLSHALPQVSTVASEPVGANQQKGLSSTQAPLPPRIPTLNKPRDASDATDAKRRINSTPTHSTTTSQSDTHLPPLTTSNNPDSSTDEASTPQTPQIKTEAAPAELKKAKPHTANHINPADKPKVSTFANAPAQLKLKDNAQATLPLSYRGMNRLFVRHDRIKAIRHPISRMSFKPGSDGDAYISIVGQLPFTIYVKTELGRYFSLLIVPVNTPGKTTEIVPLTYHARHIKTATDDEARLGKQDYVHLLTDLLHAVMNHKTPDGYVQVKPASLAEVPSLSRHIPGLNGTQVYLVAGFVGDRLAIRQLRIVNESAQPRVLRESRFYTPGVRAVALGAQTLNPQSSADIFEVLSND